MQHRGSIVRFYHRYQDRHAHKVSSLAYSFLNPKKQGKRLAAYIVGIAVGQIIIFLIVRGIIVLRERLTRRKLKSTSGAPVNMTQSA